MGAFQSCPSRMGSLKLCLKWRQSREHWENRMLTFDEIHDRSAPDWSPFQICQEGVRAPAPRDIRSAEGIGDRIRAAAFAEIQARDAFDWAARHFEDAPPALREAWKGLALAEDKHLNWLL